MSWTVGMVEVVAEAAGVLLPPVLRAELQVGARVEPRLDFLVDFEEAVEAVEQRVKLSGRRCGPLVLRG